jgi:hypothetical protein
MKSRTPFVSIVLLAVATTAQAAISLTPGTVIAVRGDSIANQRTLVQLDPNTGAVLGELVVPGDPSRGLGPICVLNGELFMAQRIDFTMNSVTRIDLSTGLAYGNSFAVPNGGLRRRGDLLVVTGGTYTEGAFDPSTGTQVAGFQQIATSALQAPFNVPYFSPPWRGVMWNGQGFTAVFDDTLTNGAGYNALGSARLLHFDANFQPVQPWSPVTLQQAGFQTSILGVDIDEFSGDVWTHHVNIFQTSAPEYLQRYNPATGQTTSFALPFDISLFSVVPIPAPGATSVVGLALVFAARRRRRV